jgi:hypothetical protein
MKKIALICSCFFALSCASLQQDRLRTALDKARDMTTTEEAQLLLDELNTEHPHAQWACRAIDVAQEILDRVTDAKEAKIYRSILALAGALCPPVSAP